jgi:hypothetical protein
VARRNRGCVSGAVESAGLDAGSPVGSKLTRTSFPVAHPEIANAA